MNFYKHCLELERRYADSAEASRALADAVAFFCQYLNFLVEQTTLLPELEDEKEESQ